MKFPSIGHGSFVNGIEITLQSVQLRYLVRAFPVAHSLLGPCEKYVKPFCGIFLACKVYVLPSTFLKTHANRGSQVFSHSSILIHFGSTVLNGVHAVSSLRDAKFMIRADR